jgi:chitinase
LAACGSDDTSQDRATTGEPAGTTQMTTGSAGAGTSSGEGGSTGASGSNGAGGSSETGGDSSGRGGSNAGGAGGSGGSGGKASGGWGGMTNSGGAGGGSGGAPSGAIEYSPYYEIGSTTGAFKNLVDLKTKAGVSDVTLAFVLSGGGCSTDKTIPDDLSDIKAFVAAGGHVKASFGGAGGRYVEAGCTDASSLATAIGNFVDATGITDLDFDIEQAPVETTAENAKRGQALKMVQDTKHILVSFTLQTDESGLDSGARSVLGGAVNAGVQVSHVNAMVMDYGDKPAGTPMAPIAIGTLNGANAQLKKMIAGLTTEQAWAMLGATPDIGQNDDNEIFTLKDAQDLIAFAKQNKLGLVSFWNIQRDQVCGRGECSEHDNANFDYSNIFKTVLP